MIATYRSVSDGYMLIVQYAKADWPSYSIWLVPGTEEDLDA